MTDREYQKAVKMLEAFDKEWGELSVHAVESFLKVRPCYHIC